MPEPTRTTDSQPGAGRFLFPASALILICSFLYRLTVEAHEYALFPERAMTMTMDALLIVGLVAWRKKFTSLAPLFWIALVCGIGLFAIRLTGDAQWATGHLHYGLLPR